jgi:F-type H+-transporting ATPase subunit delta
MNDSQISVRYARALFESALEKALLDPVRNDMIEMQHILLIPEFQKLMISPVIKESKKIVIVKRLLEGRVQSITLSFMELLIKNGREFYIPAIARNFLDLYRKQSGIRSATFISAVPVSENLKIRIHKVIEKEIKSIIELKMETNEDLIGGFIIRIDDRQYDASVASSLRKMKKTLLN